MNHMSTTAAGRQTIGSSREKMVQKLPLKDITQLLFNNSLKGNSS